MPRMPSAAPPVCATTAATTMPRQRSRSVVSPTQVPLRAYPTATAPTRTTIVRPTPVSLRTREPQRRERASIGVFESLLVANRGEIARRVLRTAARMGLRTIAVHSEADTDLPFVHEADEAVLLGSAPPAESYLDAEKVIEAARRTGAEAIHPGYGFLAENAEFAQAVVDAGLVWVGPGPDAIDAMGDKVKARNRMSAAGVPVAPGTTDPVATVGDALTAAESIGYPLMVKAAAGGGGIGMGVARDEGELRTAFETARSRASRFFSSPAILLERYI